ncbi:MAG: PAS domain-containing sensor histidine kinase [Ghiorsea sp.]|nr:PAS domain-containing sensor histidine kinase [Ghiorsea sp.]
MDCGYAALDQHGHFLETNATFSAMFGYSENTLLLMDIEALWMDVARLISFLEQVKEEGVLHHYKAELKHQHGALLSVFINAAYLPEQQVYMLCVYPSMVLGTSHEHTPQQALIASKTGTTGTAFQPFSLADLALSVMQRYEHVFVGKPRVFTYDIMKNMPMCMGHEQQVLRLLSCMMDNAIEATKMGDSITVYVRTSMLKHKSTGLDEQYVMLSVQDNGVGMDAETQKHIFEPNFSTKLEGRGMSLARALKVIKKHNARIHVKTGPKMGSLFKVYFPVCSHE